MANLPLPEETEGGHHPRREVPRPRQAAEALPAHPRQHRTRTGCSPSPARRAVAVQEQYRHEFGSLLDVLDRSATFRALNDEPDMQELVLHLIAVHHGRGRPHFPADEAFDPEPRGGETRPRSPSRCRSGSPGCNASTAAGDWRIWNRCCGPPTTRPARSRPGSWRTNDEHPHQRGPDQPRPVLRLLRAARTRRPAVAGGGRVVRGAGVLHLRER